MEMLRKSQKLKKIRLKYAYIVPEKSVPYTVLGDPIILGVQNKYVCGACLLLLRNLDVRFWLRSPFVGMLQMPHMQMTPFAVSKCGCEMNLIMRNPSLFLNYHPGDESIFTGFYLTCRCILEIRAEVDGSFRTERNEKQGFLQNSGVKVMLTQQRLMALESWHFISVSI